MIRRLISKQINSITIAAILIATSSLISRFLGIFRDRILASEFGASPTLDVYYAAFRIPDLLFNLLVLGALSAGFIPIFTCLIKDPKCKLKTLFNSSANEEAWNLVNNILNIIILVLAVLSLAGIIFAPQLTRLIAPGFSPEMQKMTADLSRIMFLSPIFLGISSVLGGILQSFRRFFVYSLSPIMYNIGIIIGALYLVPRFGIYGLAWGVVLGAFLHMLIQIPSAFGLGYRYRLKINIRNGNIRQIGRMMIPRTMSLAISQINLLVITIIASTLAGGSLAIFNFANNLQSFPIGIFGISYAVAAFPALSRVAFNTKKLVYNFSSTIRQILFFIVPSTVLLITLKAQIIRVILGAGEFDWTATLLTIKCLEFFAISLFAQATMPLLIRVFYARHNSKTPFAIGIISAMINVLLALLLSRHQGVSGLVLAFSIANIFNFFILWIALRIELNNLDEKRIILSVSKFIVASFACGLVIQGTKYVIEPLLNMDKLWGVLTQGLTAGIFGMITYLAFCSLLKSEEFLDFWFAIKKRLPWRKVQTGDQGEARGI